LNFTDNENNQYVRSAETYVLSFMNAVTSYLHR
jgi:hypothetical protein